MSSATDPSYPSRQMTKLLPEDGDNEDNFGESIAVSDDGTIAIIGARHDEDPMEGDGLSGAAYVFERGEEGWSQQVKLTADSARADKFGESVEMSGDGTTAIIGGFDDRNGGLGSAYVFERDDGEWSQQVKLTPKDTKNDEFFRPRIAVSGDGTTVIIGVEHDDEPNGERAGSAYVFAHTNGEWRQQAKLAPDDGDPKDAFGARVALSGDGTTAIIGALGDEDPNGVDHQTGDSGGSAYVFEKIDGEWRQQAKLAPEDGDRNDAFGIPTVSSDGTTAIIGPSNTKGGGEAYVFAQTDGGWSQQTKLTAGDHTSGHNYEALGGPVASNDASIVMIGDPDGHQTGVAYVFEHADDGWNQRVRLAPTDPNDGEDEDMFGGEIAVSGDGTTAIIGARNDEDPNGEEAGSVYVYE